MTKSGLGRSFVIFSLFTQNFRMLCAWRQKRKTITKNKYLKRERMFLAGTLNTSSAYWTASVVILKLVTFAQAVLYVSWPVNTVRSVVTTRPSQGDLWPCCQIIFSDSHVYAALFSNCVGVIVISLLRYFRSLPHIASVDKGTYACDICLQK